MGSQIPRAKPIDSAAAAKCGNQAELIAIELDFPISRTRDGRMSLNVFMRITAATATVEHWYTNGTVIGITGVVIGVAGVIVAIVLWRFGTPRGLLEYSMHEPKALVSRSSSVDTNELEVTFHGKKVQDPYLATIRLANHGNRDVRSSDFDQNQPIVFDLNAEIIDVLSSSNPDARHFSFEKEGKLLLPPTLIRRNEEISVDVLTEGAPTLSCHQKLADVKVRLDQSWDQPPLKSYMGVIGAALITGLGVDIMKYKPPHGQNDTASAGIITTAGFIIVIMGFSMFLIAFKRLGRTYRRSERLTKRLGLRLGRRGA